MRRKPKPIFVGSAFSVSIEGGEFFCDFLRKDQKYYAETDEQGDPVFYQIFHFTVLIKLEFVGEEGASDRVSRLPAVHNMTQSMFRKENCLDDGIMENFFERLKVEEYIVTTTRESL